MFSASKQASLVYCKVNEFNSESSVIIWVLYCAVDFDLSLWAVIKNKINKTITEKFKIFEKLSSKLALLKIKYFKMRFMHTCLGMKFLT